MDRIAISGIGIVSPGAFGREAFERVLSASRRGDRACRVPDFVLEEYLKSPRSFRRVADATKFALASMALAVTDAGFSIENFGGERTGLVVGITHGAVTYAIQFHRSLLLEGPLSVSPLNFSESVPNAPAGNGAIAFQIRGPVHTLIGEEPVGAQAIDLAASLLRGRFVDRCLVVGTEEWNEVLGHVYGQLDRAPRKKQDPGDTPVLSDGAAALVLELESALLRRGAAPHAVISGWNIGRCRTRRMEDAAADVVREAFRPTGREVADADHVLPPTGRYRCAATRGVVVARGETAPPPTWVDLHPVVGNPVGASNLFQVAASAVMISARRMDGPGLALSTGIQRTLSAVVLCRAELT